MDEFERVRFIANEDTLGNFGGIESDHISHFYEKFVNNFDSGEKISAKQLELYQIDQKYISIFLSFFHRKFNQKEYEDSQAKLTESIKQKMKMKMAALMNPD